MCAKPSNIEIGILKPAEFAVLADLMRVTWTAAFGADMAPSDVDAHLHEELSDTAIRGYVAADRFLVARLGRRLTGFVQFGPAPGGYPKAFAGDVEIRRLYVLGGNQGRGIGSLLLASAFADPFTKRAARIYICVWEDNRGARRLYMRHGFHPVGTKLFMVDGQILGHDLVLMREAPTRGLASPPGAAS